MSYLVLARKWRPQTFRDLVGQEHVSQTLQNAIQSGRVAHAFLFTGARGVGKTSAARILAKALACEQGPTVEPCNTCPACSEITNGTSVDVFEIDGASNTGVDDIRELRENVKYLPSRARYKIFIIDEVHMLSTSAFNALLKTLEEPPPHVKFIFATTEPHKVPVTILSRCQRFDFRRIPLPALSARLREIVNEEQVVISDEALHLVARKGDGSMRDALSTLDQVLAFCGNTVADADVVQLLGVVDRRLLAAAGRAVLEHDSRAALEVVRQVDQFGYSMRQFGQELLGWFRNLMVLKVVDRPDGLLELSDAELAETRQLAAVASLDDLQRQLALLLKADQELAHSAFPRFQLELVLVKLTNLQPVLPIGQALEQLQAMAAGRSVERVASPEPRWQGAAATAPAAVATPPRKAAVTANIVADAPASSPSATERAAITGSVAEAGDWDGFIARVRRERPALAGVLEHGSPLQFAAERVVIGFPPGSFYLQSLQDADNQQQLRELLGTFLGKQPPLELVSLADGTEAPLPLAEQQRRDAEQEAVRQEREAREHPAVTAAVELLGGTLNVGPRS